MDTLSRYKLNLTFLQIHSTSKLIRDEIENIEHSSADNNQRRWGKNNIEGVINSFFVNPTIDSKKPRTAEMEHIVFL